MQDTFFTSKQVGELTGCTLRQLQYWREKEIIVPVISETGTGRSIYYSKTNLVELAAILHWLSIGLNFDITSAILETLKDKEPELFKSGKGKRYMLLWEKKLMQARINRLEYSLVEYNRELAMLAFDAGKPVIPVWMDVIYHELTSKLANKA